MMKIFCGLVLIFLFCQTIAINPGAKVKISKQGLNYAAKRAIDILEKKIKTVNIPNQSGSKWRVENIRITNFVKPLAVINTNPSSGMTIGLYKGALAMEANWRYKLLFIKLSGSVRASSGSISLSQSIRITNSGGKPRFTAGSCNAGLGSFRIKTSGGASWFINLLLGLFRGKIRRMLERKICDSLTNIININANEELATLNLNAKIDNNFVLDYSLVSNPVFGSNYLESPHKGRFLADPQSNINAGALNIPSSKMVSIGFSQEVFNSAGRVVQKKNLFYYNFIMKEKLILNLFSPAYNLSSIRCTVRGISAPMVSITNKGIKVTMDLQATFFSNIGFISPPKTKKPVTFPPIVPFTLPKKPTIPRFTGKFEPFKPLPFEFSPIQIEKKSLHDKPIKFEPLPDEPQLPPVPFTKFPVPPKPFTGFPFPVEPFPPKHFTLKPNPSFTLPKVDILPWKPVKLLDIKVQVSASVKASVSGDKIIGIISNIDTNATVSTSVIPGINSAFLNSLLDSSKPLLLPQINNKLQKGFDLPKNKNLRFVSPSLSYYNGYLVVSTNVV